MSRLVTTDFMDQAAVSRLSAAATTLCRPDLPVGADTLCLHVPLTLRTGQALDAAALARMKPAAMPVDTARFAGLPISIPTPYLAGVTEEPIIRLSDLVADQVIVCLTERG